MRRIYAMHGAPVVRFLPKLGREISHGLFFAFTPAAGVRRVVPCQARKAHRNLI